MIFLYTGIALAIVLAALAFYFYKNNSGKQSELDDSVEEIPHDTTDITLKALLLFNIELRDNLVNDTVVTKTEEVIDLVKVLVEPVNVNHISEMTPVVNRMATHYLPQLLFPFMKLNESEKAKNTTTMLEKLESLKSELTKVKNTLDSNNTAAFDKQADFISAMFTDSVDNF